MWPKKSVFQVNGLLYFDWCSCFAFVFLFALCDLEPSIAPVSPGLRKSCFVLLTRVSHWSQYAAVSRASVDRVFFRPPPPAHISLRGSGVRIPRLFGSWVRNFTSNEIEFGLSPFQIRASAPVQNRQPPPEHWSFQARGPGSAEIF